ncbi:MAG: DUF6057 family protein [Prevotella sp.]
MKKVFTDRWLHPIATVTFGIAVMLFWLLGYPEALNYQEQNQLFLFTADYFVNDVKMVGGLADYISEFIVQFYYIPWLGAMLLGIVYATMQWLMWKVVERYDRRFFTSSFILPLLMLWYQGDIDVLLSMHIALIMALGTSVLAARLEQTKPVVIIFDFFVIPALYWTAGPTSIMYALLRFVDKEKIGVFSFGWAFFYIIIAYSIVDYQWSLTLLLFGPNYYRIISQPTLWQFLIPLSAVAIAFIARLQIIYLNNYRELYRSILTQFEDMEYYMNKKILLTKKLLAFVQDAYLRILQYALPIQLVAVVFIAFFALTKGYDSFIYEMLWQDSMVRQERWHDIIDRAREHQDDNAFSSECVNLALGMTGQLADRMFMFKQSGSDALLLRSVRDNMSDMPTAEAFFRLGMVNSALRYMFDIQQSILNFRKSGRCTKRIAECYIINGNYKAAAKHLELLKHSLFYSSWAKDAETYLNKDAKIECHKTWGKLRRLRFKDEFLYNYDEKDKMLGLLFMNNTENRLALSYFMGQLLLDGKFSEFMGYLPWVQQYGGYVQMPYGYADAVQAIKQKGNVPGSAYAKYATKMMNKIKN